MRTPRVFELATHGILVHTPHHVDNKIPFYRLNRAAADLEREFGGTFLEYRFSWADVRNTFKTCQLYDYQTKTWHRFSDEPSYALEHPTAV